MRLTRPAKPYFQLSGFIKYSQEERQIIEKIKQLGGVPLNTQTFDPKCTHLVTKKLTRTEKYLGACATGKFVVSTNYIHDCYNQKQWLDPTSYEYQPNGMNLSYLQTISAAPSRCREKIKRDNSKGMFDGWHVALHLEDKNRKDVFRRILMNGGATLVHLKFPLGNAGVVPYLSHVFVDKNKSSDVKLLQNRGIPCLSLDYIRSYLLLDPCPRMEQFSIDEYDYANDIFQSELSFGSTNLASCGEENKNRDGGKMHKLTRKRKSDELPCGNETDSKLHKQIFKSERDIFNDKINAPARTVSPLSSQNSGSCVKMLKYSESIAKAVASGNLSKKQLELYKSLKSTPDGKHQRTLDRFIKPNYEYVKPKEEIVFPTKLPENPVIRVPKAKKSLNSILSIDQSDEIEILYENFRPKTDAFVAPKRRESVKQMNEVEVLCVVSSPSKPLRQQLLNTERSPCGQLILQSPPKCLSAASSPSPSKPLPNVERSPRGKLISQPPSKCLPAASSPSPAKPLRQQLLNIEQSHCRKLILQSPSKHPSPSGSTSDQGVPDSMETDVHDRNARPLGRRKKEVKQVQTYEFPISLGDVFETCYHEMYFVRALDFVSSALSFCQYPSAWCLNTVMFKILLPSEDENVAWRAIGLLNDVLKLHPPNSPTMRHYYFKVLCMYADDTSSAFSGIHDIITQSLDHYIAEEHNSQACTPYLVLTFINEVIIQDFSFMQSQNIPFEKNHLPIIAKLFWPNSSSCYINNNCRKLLNSIARCAAACNSSNKNLRSLHQILMQLTRTLQVLCNYCKVQSSQRNEADTIAKEFASVLNAEVDDGLTLKKTLRLVRPTWFALKVTEHLCDKSQNSAMPQSDVPLSMRKIVDQYMNVAWYSPAISPSQSNEDHSGESRKLSSPCFVSKEKTEPTSSLQQWKSVNKKNGRGETQLHIACMKNKVTKMKELLSIPGIDVNARDHAGWTPLHEACNHGNSECVAELLKYKPNSIAEYFNSDSKLTVNVNSKGGEGFTALHDAVCNNHVKCVTLLLQHSGKSILEAKTNEGLLPLDFAYTKEMQELLRSSGIDATMNSENRLETCNVKPLPGLDQTEPFRDAASNKMWSNSQCRRIVEILSSLIELYARTNPKLMNDEGDAVVVRKFSIHAKEFGERLRALTNCSGLKSSRMMKNISTYLNICQGIS